MHQRDCYQPIDDPDGEYFQRPGIDYPDDRDYDSPGGPLEDDGTDEDDGFGYEPSEADYAELFAAFHGGWVSLKRVRPWEAR